MTRDTLNREVVILKKIMRRLVNAGTLRDNPALTVRQLAANNLPFHVITEKSRKILFARLFAAFAGCCRADARNSNAAD